ncbi:RAD55 family ATPase [Palaeococcus ferrophilus]|uniref:RAD55 family ATPase n=1 Tax=Palaeococcus ferrophilus TaxID=83868 RepID=UPI00064FDADE|nr:hypothetical protein [Palaeococcus ferrophilus]
MEVLSTGIPLLDEALGGGLLPDSTLLIVYDEYSQGWLLAFEILRNRVEEGDFGVVLNSVLPMSSLEMELKALNLDIRKLGEREKLAVLDIFSSFYGLNYPEKFIYTDTSIDPTTFLPKYVQLYTRLLKRMIGDKRPVGVDLTIDGMAFLLGEENFLRTLQRLMATKEKARLMEKRKRPINIWLINRARATERLTSWVALYSQYVIEFQSKDTATEKMYIRKSPLPDFQPRDGGYKFVMRRGKVEIT